MITQLFLAVGTHDAIKGGDDVTDSRGVLPTVLIPAVILMIGPLFFFFVFAENLVEHVESSLLPLGSTVLGRKGSSRLCSVGI